MNLKFKYARFFIVLLVILISYGCAAHHRNEEPNDAGKQPGYVKTIPQERPIKTIGIIGGVRWASSIEYYRLMNEMVRDRLGGVHSAEILMFSIEFGEFSKQERLADKGDWTLMTATMLDAAQRLKRGGADFIVIASNTLNSLAPLIEEKVGLPVLHIADATGKAVQKKGLRTVALLGTKHTMEHPFYRERLKKYGIDVVTPNEKERDYINTIIFDELCANRVKPEAKKEFLKIINRLRKKDGAQGVILGCTEIPLLIKQGDLDIPVFDTTAIHSAAAVEYSLKEK